MSRVTLHLPERFVYQTELNVRITDLNYGGHLGHDTVLALTHEARAQFLRQHHLTELDIDGLGIIVADAVVVYKTEAFFGDRIRLQLAAGEFNRYGCDFYYRLSLVGENREVARAKTGIVFYDYEVRKVAKAPRRFLTLFEHE